LSPASRAWRRHGAEHHAFEARASSRRDHYEIDRAIARDLDDLLGAR
jgi:hypothetical protein